MPKSLRLLLLAAGVAGSTAIGVAAPAAPAGPVSWLEIQNRPMPAPGVRVTYGGASPQFGELRVPPGRGPHPVLVLIHGGCWHRSYDLGYFSHIADALMRETGAATWNIEYRRLGDPGGGWPGTFLDVANATDQIRALADRHHLDPTRVVALGHSAGGQLALWLAARDQLPAGSAPYRPNPIKLRGVVGLAPITDLSSYARPSGGCNAAVGELLGGPPERQVLRYQQASPQALLPLGVPQWLIQGVEDPIVQTASVRAYAQAAKDAGDTVEVSEIAGTGHFDAVLPGSSAWPAVVNAVKAALAAPAPQ